MIPKEIADSGTGVKLVYCYIRDVGNATADEISQQLNLPLSSTLGLLRIMEEDLGVVEAVEASDMRFTVAQ